MSESAAGAVPHGTMSKTTSSNFFEDFAVGQALRHATPRTVTTGDVALYTSLYPLFGPVLG